jgi:hypothetical protein
LTPSENEYDVTCARTLACGRFGARGEAVVNCPVTRCAVVYGLDADV